MRTGWEQRARAAIEAQQYAAAHDAVQRLAAGPSGQSGRGVSVLDAVAIAEPLPDLEYLVGEIALVAEGGAPHMVAGYGFSGKTLAMQSLMLSLAAGLRVWGSHRVDPARVMHVDLEQGERLTRKRYQRLAAALDLHLPELGDGLGLAVMPRISLSEAHRDSWRRLMDGRQLILVDSLRAATPGVEENNSEIRVGLDMLGSISDETGCRPLVIHHARKTTKDAPGGRFAIRGSSAIFDGCDTVLAFSAEKGEPVLVEHLKARSHGELLEDFALVIDDVQIEGRPKAGLSVVMRGHELVAEKREEKARAEQRRKVAADAKRVRDALTQQPGITYSDLKEVAGMNGSRVSAAINYLGPSVRKQTCSEGRRRWTEHYLQGAS